MLPRTDPVLLPVTGKHTKTRFVAKLATHRRVCFLLRRMTGIATELGTVPEAVQRTAGEVSSRSGTIHPE